MHIAQGGSGRVTDRSGSVTVSEGDFRQLGIVPGGYRSSLRAGRPFRDDPQRVLTAIQFDQSQASTFWVTNVEPVLLQAVVSPPDKRRHTVAARGIYFAHSSVIEKLDHGLA